MPTPLERAPTTISLPRARPSRFQRTFTLISLLCINLFNYVDRQSIPAVLDDIRSYYGSEAPDSNNNGTATTLAPGTLSESEAALLQTMFVIGYMASSPLFGFLGDRYTRKYVAFSGIVVWVLAAELGTLANRDAYYGFLISRAIVGVGEAAYIAVASTVIGDMYVGAWRSYALVIFYLCIPAGGGLGFAICSNIAKATNSWQWALRIPPLMGGLAGIFLLFSVEPVRGASEGIKTTTKTGDEAKTTLREKAENYWKDLRAIFRVRTYVYSSLGFVAVTFVTGTVVFWFVQVVSYSKKIDDTNYDKNDDNTASLFGLVTIVGGIVGTVLGSVLSQWWRRRNPRADPLVCAIGLGATGILIFASLLIVRVTTVGMWVVTFIGVTTLSFSWPIVPDMLLYTIAPSRRATANGFQVLLSHILGDAISPFIVGAIAQSSRGGDESDSAQFEALQQSMYMNAFVCLIGAWCFAMGSIYVVRDRNFAQLEIDKYRRQSAWTVENDGSVNLQSTYVNPKLSAAAPPDGDGRDNADTHVLYF